MTDREKVIKAYECTDVMPDKRCSECPYGYGYLDNSGDGSPFWWCIHDNLIKKMVRCWDCRYGEHEENANHEAMVMYQNKQNSVGYGDWLVAPDWYCADGERKDDND